MVNGIVFYLILIRKEGTYIKDGKGIEKFNNGIIFEGNFKDDLKHGYGECKWADGSFY